MARWPTLLIGNKCAKNCCKRTILVQLIVENVVISPVFFWDTVYSVHLIYEYRSQGKQVEHYWNDGLRRTFHLELMIIHWGLVVLKTTLGDWPKLLHTSNSSCRSFADGENDNIICKEKVVDIMLLKFDNRRLQTKAALTDYQYRPTPQIKMSEDRTK